MNLEKIDEHVKTVCSYWFERPDIDSTRLQRQVDVLKSVVEGLKDGKENFIINAPTGFGKTILGFMLNDLFSKIQKSEINTSYIMTSNKFLQDQYERDLINFKLDTFQLLKGQSNYTCEKNGESFPKRKCLKTPLSKLPLSSKYKCQSKCRYVQDRIKAMKSECAIFNYSYFLTTMNKVFASGGDGENVSEAPFTPRPLAIFDECHVLENVVQDMFRVAICNTRLMRDLQKSLTWAKMIYQADLLNDAIFSPKDLESIDKNILATEVLFKDLVAYGGLKDLNTNDLKEIFKKLAYYQVFIKRLYDMFVKLIQRFPKDEEEYTKEQTAYANVVKLLSESSKNIQDAINLYSKDINKMVVTCEYNEETNDNYVILRYVDVAELVKKYVLKFTDVSIFMSATVGDVDDFAKNNGIDNYKGIEVQSDFDFSKSPILLVQPTLKMNYKERKTNMPILLDRIDEILNKHQHESGIIHTGTYLFMDEIEKHFDYSKHSKRLLCCRTAEQKLQFMEILKQNPNSNYVLVGASLLEGVDLKDELARFSIFAKVPYASLADRLVKRKIDLYPTWYGNITLAHILQGIGRGIRHKKDWCITYMLDGGFEGFFQRYGYHKLPSIMDNRIKTVNANKGYLSLEEQEANSKNNIPIPDFKTKQEIVDCEDDLDFSMDSVDDIDDLPF